MYHWTRLTRRAVTGRTSVLGNRTEVDRIGTGP